MSILSATASYETTLGFFPGMILINTDDDLATVKGTGYLNGITLQPCGYLGATPVCQTNQVAMVTTTDSGSVFLRVEIDGESNINLVSM